MNTMWMPVRQIAGLVYPWRRGREETASAQLLRWSLHLAFWSVLLVALWQLNRWGGVDRLLRSPWPTLHRVWLPLLAVVLYPLGWLGLGLWTSMRDTPGAAVRPDVALAWAVARQALEQAGINVRTTPAFLILGPLTPDLRALLDSLGVAALPQGVETPFQVFAHADAIFFAYQGGAGPEIAKPDRTPLQELCGCLLGERAPRHPLQGIIIVVPFAAGQTGADAQDVSTQRRDDLRVVRQTTGLELPIFFAVSGLVRTPMDGEPWFQRFPPLPDLDPAEIAAMYRLGLDNLCLERIARQVRAHLRFDAGSLSENIRHYHWLSALERWRTGFAKMLGEATQTDAAEPGMVAGCYVLPPAAQGAGLAAILRADLLRHQETACWTAATMEQDAAQQRRVRLGYGLGMLALLGSLVSALAWIGLRSQCV